MTDSAGRGFGDRIHGKEKQKGKKEHLEKKKKSKIGLELKEVPKRGTMDIYFASHVKNEDFSSELRTVFHQLKANREAGVEEEYLPVLLIEFAYWHPDILENLNRLSSGEIESFDLENFNYREFFQEVCDNVCGSGAIVNTADVPYDPIAVNRYTRLHEDSLNIPVFVQQYRRGFRLMMQALLAYYLDWYSYGRDREAKIKARYPGVMERLVNFSSKPIKVYMQFGASHRHLGDFFTKESKKFGIETTVKTNYEGNSYYDKITREQLHGDDPVQITIEQTARLWLAEILKLSQAKPELIAAIVDGLRLAQIEELFEAAANLSIQDNQTSFAINVRRILSQQHQVIAISEEEISGLELVRPNDVKESIPDPQELRENIRPAQLDLYFASHRKAEHVPNQLRQQLTALKSDPRRFEKRTTEPTVAILEMAFWTPASIQNMNRWTMGEQVRLPEYKDTKEFDDELNGLLFNSGVIVTTADIPYDEEKISANRANEQMHTQSIRDLYSFRTQLNSLIQKYCIYLNTFLRFQHDRELAILENLDQVLKKNSKPNSQIFFLIGASHQFMSSRIAELGEKYGINLRHQEQKISTALGRLTGPRIQNYDRFKLSSIEDKKTVAALLFNTVLSGSYTQDELSFLESLGIDEFELIYAQASRELATATHFDANMVNRVIYNLAKKFTNSAG